MRLFVAGATLLLALAAANAAEPTDPPPAAPARKSCEDLKAEIAAKLDAKGVQNYTLEIVSNEQAADLKEGKVVGSCDGGTNKIVYTRAK